MILTIDPSVAQVLITQIGSFIRLEDPDKVPVLQAYVAQQVEGGKGEARE